MKVICMSKTSFIIEQYWDVSNIAYSSGSVVITYTGGSTVTRSTDDYLIQILA